MRTKIHCPYCGEPIRVEVEVLEESQEYIEDCQVCCRPINFSIGSSMDEFTSITVHAENDCY